MDLLLRFSTGAPVLPALTAGGGTLLLMTSLVDCCCARLIGGLDITISQLSYKSKQRMTTVY